MFRRQKVGANIKPLCSITLPTGWAQAEDTPYEVVAGICHHGREVNTGHFTAYLIDSSEVWHVDDHRPAEQVAYVKAEELYSLWLRQRHGAQMPEYGEPPSLSSPMDVEFSPWFCKCQHHNVECCFVDWLYHHDGTVLLVQEHHLAGNPLEMAAQTAVRKGWQFFGGGQYLWARWHPWRYWGPAQVTCGSTPTKPFPQGRLWMERCSGRRSTSPYRPHFHLPQEQYWFRN